MTTLPEHVPVLVVGAGPAGLTVGIELARRGVECLVVDRRPTPRPGTRGCTLWQRTLESLDLMGVPIPSFQEQGVVFARRTFFVPGYPPLVNDLAQAGTPYPLPLVIGQDRTEQILTAHLASFGVPVLRGLTAVDAGQDPDRVTVRLVDQQGRAHVVRSDWVVAAQGPHSSVRDALGVPWDAQPFAGTQLVQVDARVEGDLPSEPEDSYLYLQPRGSLGNIPLPGGRRRIYLGIADPDPTNSADPEPAEIAAHVRDFTGADVRLTDPEFRLRLRLHNSCARSFQFGRCLLVGDTAHTVAPVMAQGLNTGLQDAFNLGWKLAAVAGGRSPQSLLASYSAEREPVAATLVENTERAYWGGVGPHPEWAHVHAGLSRNGNHNTGLPLAYPDSPLSVDRRGGDGPAAGSRVPDVGLNGSGRLFDHLRDGKWTLLVFGADPGDAPENVPEQVARQTPDVRVRLVGRDLDDPEGRLRKEFRADDGLLALVRPDGYLGWRGDLTDLGHLKSYLRGVLF